MNIYISLIKTFNSFQFTTHDSFQILYFLLKYIQFLLDFGFHVFFKSSI